MKIVKINLENNIKAKQIVKLDDENLLFITIENNKLSVYKQNINTNEISKINQNTIHCNNYTYPQIKVINQEILIEIESVNNETKGIYIINLENKKEKLHYKTNKQGNLIFLNNAYALLIGQEEYDLETYDIEKEINGEYNYAHLIDIKENKEYIIHDIKVKEGIRYELPIYTKDNNIYLILEEVHMEDYEAETIYHNHKNDKDFEYVDNQSMSIISLEEFVQNIKEEKKNLNFKIICENNYNTCINYFGQNEECFFYRTKNFDTNEEIIYKVNKENYKISVVNKFNLNKKYKEEDSCIYYDKHNQIIFLEKRQLKKIEPAKREGIPLYEVLGISQEELCENYECIVVDEYETISSEIKILDENITIKAFNNSEIPDTIAEDKLITSYWIERESEEEFICDEYVRIINLKNNEENIFKNSYVIIDNMLILY